MKKTHGMEAEKYVRPVKDNTKVRCLGEDLKTDFTCTNQIYGQNSYSEAKYQTQGIKEKLFEEFFKSYAENEKKQNNQFDDQQKNLRILHSTKQCDYKAQNPDYGSLGKRHMMTRDEVPVQQNNIDKLFLVRIKS